MYKHMIAWEPTNSTGNALQGVINFIGAYIWGSTATRKFTQKKKNLPEGLGAPIKKISE